MMRDWNPRAHPLRWAHRLAALALMLAATLALALPAPKDIDKAVAAGQLTQAETLLREVLQEKPQSAKAHYQLGQVLARQGRPQEARNALLQAQRLDPSLAFASDPKRFREMLATLSADPPAPAARVAPRSETRPLSAAPQPAAAGGGFPWTVVLIGGGLLIVGLMIWRRSTSAAGMPMAPAGGYAAGAPGGYPAGQPSSGSGVAGAVLGGVAGLAAGYGLSRMLDHGDEPHTSRHSAGQGDDLVPFDSPSSGADLGPFDAGTGDGWDSGGASGGDDSW